mmetsp:Transcript_70090/g.121337  ORF Transcript_70090/g.121337 Transcript_70090/m.121337 type:complete len:342 (-) Transcript_70090:239-1264(-)
MASWESRVLGAIESADVAAFEEAVTAATLEQLTQQVKWVTVMDGAEGMVVPSGRVYSYSCHELLFGDVNWRSRRERLTEDREDVCEEDPFSKAWHIEGRNWLIGANLKVFLDKALTVDDDIKSRMNQVLDGASLAKCRKRVADTQDQLDDLVQKRTRIAQEQQQTYSTLKETLASIWKESQPTSADLRYAVNGELVATEGRKVQLDKDTTVKSLRSQIAVAAGQKKGGLFFASIRVAFRNRRLMDNEVLSHIASPAEAAQDLEVVKVEVEAGSYLNYEGFDAAVVLSPKSTKIPLGPSEFPGNETCPECDSRMCAYERSYYTHSDICPSCNIEFSNDMGGP